MENETREVNLEQQDELGTNQEGQQDNNQEQKVQMDVGQLKQWLTEEDGKKFLQPLLDKHFTKGLETWKTNNLQKIIDGEIEKRFPTDEKEIEIRRLQKEVQDKEILAMVTTKLAEHEISPDIAPLLIGDSIESTSERLESFIGTFSKSVKKEVDNRLKELGGTPRHFTSPQITQEDINSMDYSERVELYRTRPELFRK
jgi:hypothetical protein